MRHPSLKRLHVVGPFHVVTTKTTTYFAVEAGQSIFTDLQQQAGVEGCFEVKQSRHGQGVFATRDLAKGEVSYPLHLDVYSLFIKTGKLAEHPDVRAQVMMRVPQDACIMIDYESGLSIPNLPWPRLRKGLQQRDDHPWDILQALPYSAMHLWHMHSLLLTKASTAVRPTRFSMYVLLSMATIELKSDKQTCWSWSGAGAAGCIGRRCGCLLGGVRQ